jgi:hypothetical protein
MFRTPDEIRKAYEDGLPGWQYNQKTMDALFEDGLAHLYQDACPHLAGVGAGKRALLWRSRELYDPGGYSAERQVRGSCTSHGSRSARDTTRAVEIHIKGEPEEYYKRGATEATYAARGHYGEGMDSALAARFEVENGFLFRERYSFGDLSKLNETSLVDSWTGRIPQEVLAECKKHNVGRWVTPRTADEAKDLFYSGYACHSGQNFGWSTESDAKGLIIPGRPWMHDMCSSGYDDTREFYSACVFFVPNSWGQWNQKPRFWPEEAYGPWVPGMSVVPEDLWAQYFVGSRSMFFYCDVKGVPQKNLPDYGNLAGVLG